MAYCHVAHDCQTGRGVILANNATLAGHIVIGELCNHRGPCRNSSICKNRRICLYRRQIGSSPKIFRLMSLPPATGQNFTASTGSGLKRYGFSESTVNALKKVYRIFFRIGITLNEAIERAQAEVDHLPEVNSFINFIKSSQRGITR